MLGTEIYDKLSIKNKTLKENAIKKSKEYMAELKLISTLPENSENEKIIKTVKLNNINEKVKLLKDNIDLIDKIQKEISQMKNGSIALINQITTISKQRIYNPKSDVDVLADIKLSNNSLNLIDAKIKKLFMKS